MNQIPRSVFCAICGLPALPPCYSNDGRIRCEHCAILRERPQIIIRDPPVVHSMTEGLAMNQITQEGEFCGECPCRDIEAGICTFYEEVLSHNHGVPMRLPICIQESPQIIVKEDKEDEMSKV